MALVSMKRCPNCEHPVQGDATECNRCGAYFGPGSAWISEKDLRSISEDDLRAAGYESQFKQVFAPIASILVWAGHFFFIGVPILYAIMLLIVTMQWGPPGYFGNVNGIGLGIALVVLAPLCYLPGFILRWMVPQFDEKARRAYFLSSAKDKPHSPILKILPSDTTIPKAENLSGVDKSLLGSCPNCRITVRLAAQECFRCKALFGPNSAWKVEALRRE